MRHLLLACLLPAALLAAPPEPPRASLRVDLKAERAPVPASLYGIFAEELSHAFDGGLYAELIQNRSFEEGVLPPGMKLVKKPDGGLKMELTKLPDGVPPNKWDMPWPWNMGCNWDPGRALLGWSLLKEGGAGGEMAPTEANPLNRGRLRSLALTVKAGQGRLGLANGGYWGINAVAGREYKLRFSLRPGSFRGTVRAALETREGKLLAARDCGAVEPGETWRRFDFVLAATGDDPKARLVLWFEGEGALQVAFVSLFPPTWRGQPNGLRPDLAEYLAELKPAFVRYPGGCYVEGQSWENAPDWRTMVCPPDERPGTWSCWKYRSDDGFGYHEYLQFCEDIGADALYVTFAGMTCHPENNWPLAQLDPVIQRTLDAIEYALGPVDSQWGAVRAKLGHPAPFPLKYVEIGNEHPPAIYGEYYKRFRAAIKAKYPQVTVIMSMFWSGLNPGAIAKAGDESIDIVDEHSYRGSGWIRTNFDYFDRYPRKPWRIYIGEYAHHHNAGDFGAALDDAVYLMMVERNGDLVKLASYAPLFANLNARDWGVNLIEFDSSRSFAHASYYVQKTFAETRPDVNLATTVEVTPKPDPNRPQLAGRFGLGAWNTQAEFKELRIYDEAGTLVRSDDFANLDQWETPGVGKWQVEGGVLRQSQLGLGPAQLLLKAPEFKTGKVTVKAKRVGGQEGFLLFFNAVDINRFLFCNYGAAGNNFHAIQDRGWPEAVAFRGGKTTGGKIELDRWYELSLVVTKDKAQMFLDGKLVSDASSQYLPEFFATGGYRRAEKAVVVRAANYSTEPRTVDLELAGATTVGALGTHIVLHADKLDAENSLDQPRRIVPRSSPLAGCAPRFTLTLPPLSVNVLRIPASTD